MIADLFRHPDDELYVLDVVGKDVQRVSELLCLKKIPYSIKKSHKYGIDSILFYVRTHSEANKHILDLMRFDKVSEGTIEGI